MPWPAWGRSWWCRRWGDRLARERSLAPRRSRGPRPPPAPSHPPGSLEQPLDPDGQVAYPLPGRVVDGVQDGRCHADSTQLPDPARPQKARERIMLLDEEDLDRWDVRVHWDNDTGKILGQKPAQRRLHRGLLQHRLPVSPDDPAGHLAPGGLRVDDPAGAVPGHTAAHADQAQVGI